MEEDSQNNRQIIDEHFNSIAYKYDVTTDWRKNQEITSWFSRFLKDQGRCLDLATGTGIIGEELQKSELPFVVGLDRSWKMLQNAKATLTHVVCGDALLLPFPDATFNAITVRQLFHYVDDRACLREISRVTANNGLLVCGHVSAPDDEIAGWWRKIKSIVQPLRERFYTTQELKTLVQEGGFKIERLEIIKIIRRDPWERFFVNCRRDDDPATVHEIFDATPEDLNQKLGLKILPDGLEYTQYWTLILGRH